MQVIRRGSPDGLRRALEAALSTAPSWSGPLSLPPPTGFHADEVRRTLGTGDELFTRAADRILTWGVQRYSGLTVEAERERAAAGVSFVVGLPIGPGWVLAPCRVLEVVQTDQRTALTFVTLAGHPECGIEEFAIVRGSAGTIGFEIRAISRPVSRLARLGRPVTREIQVRQTRKYLEAITASG